MFRLVVALMAWLPLVSCSASSEERALKELTRMQAGEFFKDPADRSLVEAIERGNLDQARKALERGADVNAVGRDGMTPLFWALAKQNLDGFRFLLEHRADPNIVVELPDHFQGKQAGAMEMAAGLENMEYLRALLAHGGDPNAIVNDEWQIPVLYRAIMNRRLENVRLLLAHGANIDHQDKSGKTPLMQAVSGRLYEVALLLLNEGADPTIQNKSGAGPADIVSKFGDRGIDTRTNDLAAYRDFVAELKERGLLE